MPDLNERYGVADTVAILLPPGCAALRIQSTQEEGKRGNES